MDETTLHDRLEGLASRTAPPPREPVELVAEVLTRHRARRRGTWMVAAVATAAAVLLVAVPVMRSVRSSDSRPATPAGSQHAVYTAPTRGSLAGDADFLDAVRRLPWNADGRAPGLPDPRIPDPPVDSRNVVWADDAAGFRWVLVAGVDPLGPHGSDDASGEHLGASGSVAVAWFGGRSGAGPEELELTSLSYGLNPDLPTALAVNGTTVIIVGAPHEQFEVSERPSIDAGGAVRRTWESVAPRQGVLVPRYDGAVPEYSALRYRVIRHGQRVIGAPVTVENPMIPSPEIPLRWLRPAPPAAAGDVAVQSETTNVMSRLGLSSGQATVDGLWGGDIPLPDGATGRLTLLAVQVPSGAYVVSAVLGYDGGGNSTSVTTCGTEIRPAGAALDQAIFAVLCDAAAGSGTAPTHSLVVVAPSGAEMARLRASNGTLLDEYPLVGGVAVIPAPERLATVEVVDASGGTIERRAVMGSVDFGD